jgi:hypothetical protein
MQTVAELAEELTVNRGDVVVHFAELAKAMRTSGT